MTFRAPEIMVSDGQFYNASDPKPEVLTLENIAIAMSNPSRWGGHMGIVGVNLQHYSASPIPKESVPLTLFPSTYTTAEHSVIGAQYYLSQGRPDLARLFMMHDALEPFATGGDIPTPLKNYMLAVHVWEALGQNVVLDAFDLEGDFSMIKEVDRRICRNESMALYGDSQEWLKDIEPLRFKGEVIPLYFWDNKEAANQWYRLAHKLELKNKYA